MLPDLAPLDNETIFRQAFSDHFVFKRFIGDILGLEMQFSQIETEKLNPLQTGYYDYALDVFAESEDNRFAVGIQRIVCNNSFNRSIHCLMKNMAHFQQNAPPEKQYRSYYPIILLIAPFKLDKTTGTGVRDDSMLTVLSVGNLVNEVVRVYGQRPFFLNPHNRVRNAPARYRDWQDLFFQSYYNFRDYSLNLENEGIRKAIELISYDNLDNQTKHILKIQTHLNIALNVQREEGDRNARIEMAQTAISKGMDDDLIMELTHLDKDEVLELREKVERSVFK